jgi:hypothetical protein
MGRPAGLLVCQGPGSTVRWHGCLHNRFLWQGKGDTATLSISKNPEETDLRTDQTFIGCTIIKLCDSIWSIFLISPGTLTIIFWHCCPCNLSEEHHSPWLDASSTVLGYSCTWGMKGWQLVRAGLWKLFPGFNGNCGIGINNHFLGPYFPSLRSYAKPPASIALLLALCYRRCAPLTKPGPLHELRTNRSLQSILLGYPVMF